MMDSASDPELLAGGLSWPTSLAFDDQGVPLVAESGLPFGGAEPGGRVLRLSPGGTQVLAAGLRAPVNGLTCHQGAIFVSEGGSPGRISRIDPDGTVSTILDDLPGGGNYHTNMTAIGPDGRLYFSQGAMTNTAIVGLDALELGWLRRLPHSHDTAGYDLVLAGVNVTTPDPLAADGSPAVTGAFVPFGTPTLRGQRVAARVPCSASVMSCRADGSDLRTVAWGLRNAYGLGFLPDGRLLAIDQGPDDRGSRPIGNAPDLLFEVKDGTWYGWPDFIGGIPVTDPRFGPERGPAPSFVLANHDELPPPERALLAFPPHSAAVKFDMLPAGSPFAGHLLVALFGDERPMTAPEGPKVGRSIVRVEPADWSLHRVSPASFLRPIDVRVNPKTGDVHVLDFGRFEMGQDGNLTARSCTGALWRLAK